MEVLELGYLPAAVLGLPSFIAQLGPPALTAALLGLALGAGALVLTRGTRLQRLLVVSSWVSLASSLVGLGLAGTGSMPWGTGATSSRPGSPS